MERSLKFIDIYADESNIEIELLGLKPYRPFLHVHPNQF